jgi:hypothetical protein
VAFFCITKVGRKIELIFELKLQLANSIFWCFSADDIHDTQYEVHERFWHLWLVKTFIFGENPLWELELILAQF